MTGDSTADSTAGDRPTLQDLTEAYHRAVHVHDLEAEFAALGALTAAYPDTGWAWFDLGLRHKWLRQWADCVDANIEALARLDDPRESGEAWNLGIAATALGEWALARRAWDAYGIALPGPTGETGPADPAAPIEADFGLTPIRLNPDPRFHEPELLLDGVRYSTEVVWARRLCPTRARIESVPFPESGHRFGDVVLHDGDPVGERAYGDGTRAVFNEIMLLEPSPYPTLATLVPNAGTEALAELTELFAEAGYAAECWTSNVRALCRACSEGNPDGHTHDEEDAVTGLDNAELVTIGIGAPAQEAERLLASWVVRGADRDFAKLEQLL
ncbi:MAG: hypothetical protein WAW88_16070 [Nocardioides sp.]